MSEEVPETFEGPAGTKLKIHSGKIHPGSEIVIETEWECVDFPIEDFEAFVKFWNSRANHHEELLEAARNLELWYRAGGCRHTSPDALMANLMTVIAKTQRS